MEFIPVIAACLVVAVILIWILFRREVGSDREGDFARQPRRVPKESDSAREARETRENIGLTMSAGLYQPEDLKFLHEVGGLQWAATPPVDLSKTPAQQQAKRYRAARKLNIELDIAPGDCDCAWNLSGYIDVINAACEYHGHLAMRPGKKANKSSSGLKKQHTEQYDDFMLGSRECTCAKCRDSSNPACSFGCEACHDEEYQRKLSEHESTKVTLRPNPRLIRDITA